MAIYLIDYENTGVKGLAGIETLREEDLVIIFYGPKTGSMPFDEHVKISSAVSHVEYIKTAKTAKNYLDFQLTTYLGYLIASTGIRDYIIISKDSGYDSAIDFWRSRGIKLKRREAIAGVSGKETTDKKNEHKGQSKSQTGQARGRNRGRGKENQPAITNAAGSEPVSANAGSEPVATNAGSEPVSMSAAANATSEPRNMSVAANATESEPVGTSVAESKPVAADEPESNPAMAKASKSKPVATKSATSEPVVTKKTSVPESARKKIRGALKGENLQGGIYKQIYASMLSATDKQTYNTALVRVFGQDEGNHFYKLTVPFFVEWLKS